MGQSAVVSVEQLDADWILAPERYDPRRRTQFLVGLSQVAMVARDSVNPGKGDRKQLFLVLDTGDAHEGVILTNKKPITTEEMGSTKKLICPGDVIISRLRPYLHQVAYVDAELVEGFDYPLQIACSTEFFVLRSPDAKSIAFLVPYLLSPKVQEVLFASQEGGHHPRFNQTTLEKLPIPEWLLESRDKISQTVETAIRSIRQGDLTLRNLVDRCSGHAANAQQQSNYAQLNLLAGEATVPVDDEEIDEELGEEE